MILKIVRKTGRDFNNVEMQECKEIKYVQNRIFIDGYTKTIEVQEFDELFIMNDAGKTIDKFLPKCVEDTIR